MQPPHTSGSAERGLIRCKKHIKQICAFKGMRWKNITPTDLDMFIDFGNKLFVFGETKLVGSPLSLGQRLSLERLCVACQSVGIDSMALFTEHNSHGEEIIMSETIVKEWFYKNKWRTPRSATTCNQAIEAMRKKLGIA